MKIINLSKLSKETREAIRRELASPSLIMSPELIKELENLNKKHKVDHLWQALASFIKEEEIAAAFGSIIKLSDFFSYDKLEITDLRKELIEKVKYLCEQRIVDFKKIFLSL